MHDWKSFLWPADEFVMAYASPPHNIPIAKIFCIGHAVELYLKSVYSKQIGNINQAIGLGHDIAKLFAECKKQDNKFMSGYELRSTVLQNDQFSQISWLNNLNNSDRDHYFKNQEFYLIAKHQKDLKYFGTKIHGRTGEASMAFICPNDYWATFIKQIRDYLDYKEEGIGDKIEAYLEFEKGKIPLTTKEFLEKTIE